MEQVEGCYGCRMLARRVADAQATIAALQARVQKLELRRTPTHGSCCTCQRCGMDYDSCRCSLDDVCDELDEVKAQLTQRTAELEAANQRVAAMQATVTQTSVVLQAELERVRGERYEANELVAALSSKVAEYEIELNGDPQNFYGRGRTVGLRTLIAALPKVEGEIRVEEGKVISVEPIRGANPPLWWRRTIATFEDGLLAKNYANALQHRQGMEG